MMYHIKNGWFFRRLAFGKVAVEKRDGLKETAPLMEYIVFTPEEWAHIVALVSSGGEVNERKQQALDFHQS